MEQILIRNLPAGTKAALRCRAEKHQRSLEAEVRAILADAAASEPVTLVRLIGMEDADHAEIDFEPERLGLRARTADL